MKIPLYYILKNFTARKLTTSITVAGITLTVLAFTCVLMTSEGVRRAMISNGSDNNVLIARKASTGELTSLIDRETANTIAALPAVAKSPEGKPLITMDMVSIFNLDKKSGGMSNISVRGISAAAFDLRPQVKLIQGRMFNWGARELVVGKAAQERFKGASIGDKVKLAGNEWEIVGIMDGSGSSFNSEAWCDAEQFMQANNRSVYSTITFRMTDPSLLQSLKTQFESDPRLNVFEADTERHFFEKQSENMTDFFNGIGLTLTIMFGMGVTIGASITMYSAVANRTTEVGTLRAIGFYRSSVMIAFLLESLLIALVGGGIGIFLASFMQFFETSMLNGGTFSELAFKLTMSPKIIGISVGFALMIGLIGGFLPSWRASRLTIIDALRGA